MSNYWFRFLLARLRRPFAIFHSQQRKQHTFKVPLGWNSKITSLLLLQQNLRVLLLLSTSTTTTFTTNTRLRMSISSSASAALSSTSLSSWNPTHIADLSADILQRFVPPLSAKTSYKGSSGRVGVLGGSERYTGAPYYAAMSALTVGADLAYVFCAKEAAIPIKCYSPELMVSPVYSAEEFDKAAAATETTGSITPNHPMVRSMVTQVTSMLDRLHALIIGPGLGRCPLVMCATAEIIRQAISYHNIPLVLDADALFLLTQTPYKDLFLLPEDVMPRTIVLTPNSIELKRLLQAINETSEGEEKWRIQQSYRGVIVVQKGQYDTVFFASSLFHKNGTIMPPEETVAEGTISLVCKEEGGLKRSGGIGDILSGSIGTFLAWERLLTEPKRNTVTTNNHDPSTTTKTSRALVPLLQEKDRLVPCWVACCIVKRATKVAYDKKRRAMTAPNVLNEIGTVVDETITSVLDTL